MNSNTINIFQIAYSGETLKPAAPGLMVYDTVSDPAFERRETYHFRKFHEKKGHCGADFTGLVSPLFPKKTQMNVEFVKSFIRQNPGFDVYFINPSPQLAYFAYNTWDNVGFYLPKIAEVANRVFAAAGMPIDVYGLPRNSHDTLSFCNYWFGNERFWNEFTSFIKQVDAGVENLPDEVRSEIFRPGQSNGLGRFRTPEKTPLYPYIFENLFSTFLILRRDIRAKAMPYTLDQIIDRCETITLKKIVSLWAPLIDKWDRTGLPFHEDQKKILRLLQQMKHFFNGAEEEIHGLARHIEYLKEQAALKEPLPL